MSRYNDLVIAYIPLSIPLSLKLLFTSLIYTYTILDKECRVKNRGLLLLSILFSHTQLSDTVSIIKECLKLSDYKVYVIVSAYSFDKIAMFLKETSLVDCESIFKIEVGEVDADAIAKIYRIEYPGSWDYFEKLLLTKISRHYLTKLL